MPYAENDGVRLFYVETGSGTPLLFLHEYGGDPRSWAPQAEFFAGRYRCLVAASRGYPPSDVPEDGTQYGQDIAIADALAVLDAAGAESACVIGLSMGAYTGLRLALEHPDRVRALVAVSGGAGSYPEARDAFRDEARALADRMLERGQVDADSFANGPTRVQLKRKRPEAWAEFRDQFAEHPAVGAALTLTHIQAARPSLYDFERDLEACQVPTLLMVGDEDEPCLDVNLFLKRSMPRAGLHVAPKSGHLLNLEDPAGFNAVVVRFFEAVERDAWPVRETPAGSYAGVGPVMDET